MSALENLVKQITSRTTSSFVFTCSNFEININSYPLVNQNQSNNLNYFPITQEFYKSYEINGFSQVKLLSKIKPKNVVRTKNKKMMFPNEFNSIMDSLNTRISIIFFKNSKLFQSDAFLLSSPIINAMFFVSSNMTSTFISNQIEYGNKIRKVKNSFLKNS